MSRMEWKMLGTKASIEEELERDGGLPLETELYYQRVLRVLKLRYNR